MAGDLIGVSMSPSTTPTKSPVRDCSREKPTLHERVRLFFADNHRAAGRWTGIGWYSEGREVEPTHWQYFDAPHRTT